MATHVRMSGLYWWRLSRWSPRGAAQLLTWWGRWVSDADGRVVLRSVVANMHMPERPTLQLVQRLNGAPPRRSERDVDAHHRSAEFRRTRRQHAWAIGWRSFLSLVVVVAAAAFLLLVVAGAHPAAQVASVAAALPAVGAAGRPRDEPVISRAVDDGRPDRIDWEDVANALAALPIPGLKNMPEAVKFLARTIRDDVGYLFEVQLPPPAIVSDVATNRTRLAGVLAKSLGSVWPEEGRHPGHLLLHIGHQDMRDMPPPPSPLINAERWDFYQPIPFGHDERAQLVPFDLTFSSMLISAVPQQGKTNTLYGIIGTAAVDPTVEMTLIDFKGVHAFGCFRPVAHRYLSGDDDVTVEAAMVMLRDIRTDLSRRAATIGQMPARCPGKRVNRSVSNDPTLGLHQHLVVIDECQMLFTDPKHGAEAARIVEDIIRRGAGLGLIVVLATQSPNADSLPSRINAVIGARFCMRLINHTANDQALSSGSYKAGINATTLEKSDTGIGWLIGGRSSAPQVVRTFYYDDPTLGRLADRALALRVADGRPTSLALVVDGIVSTVPRGDVLDDLVAIWPDGKRRVWCSTLAELLAGKWPETYGSWTKAEVASAARARGLKTPQVNGAGGGGRIGLALDQVLAAIAGRDR